MTSAVLGSILASRLPPFTDAPHLSGVNLGERSRPRILMLMNASARVITTAPLPALMLLIISGGVAVLFLLVYIGIALPAVWSAKPARRKAAAAVLRQILDACTGSGRR